MTQCGKCDFTFDPAKVPGGLCPRCLLLGVHDLRAAVLRPEPAETEPVEALADEELTAELPGFELVETLGRGGMGVVWKATERVLNRHVAIKLLHNLKKDMDFVERFAREARVMARLSHPNIVTLFSFGRTRSNHCYLVMEMVEGTDLGRLLVQGPLEQADALRITTDLCTALKHAHDTGFMHRDVKPGNVLVDARGRIKVADFGLARLTDDLAATSITRHGTAVGTPHYVAPEQARGDGGEDHRADIYSVGVMLYQMLTGELPRGIFSPPSEKRRIDRRLDRIVFRALQEAPEKRYQNFGEMLQDLQRVRANVDPGLQAEQKAARHATRWRQRLEMALAIAVSLVLGIVMADYVRGWLQPSVRNDAAAAAPPADGGVSVADAARLAPAGGVRILREIRLQPPGLTNGALFGRSLAADGDWVAVGAPDDGSQNAADPGCVYLYRRDDTRGWSLQQVLANPHRGGGVRFGYDVALRGSRLLVGSPRRSASPKSSARLDLFELPASGSRWRAFLPALPAWAAPSPGMEVLLAGDRVIAFEPPGNGGAPPRGPAALFALPAGAKAWTRETLVPGLAACATAGSEIIGSFPDGVENVPPSLKGAPLFAVPGGRVDPLDSAAGLRPPEGGIAASPKHFFCLAATDDAVFAGNSDWNHAAGIAWMLRRAPGGGWMHDAWFRPPQPVGPCEFAESVALAPGWAAIGAGAYAAGGARRGAVFLYRRLATGSWDQVMIIPGGPESGAMDFGHSLSLTPRFIAAGAPGSGGAGSTSEEAGTGAAFVYEFEAPLR